MLGKARQQIWLLLQALFFDDWITGSLELILPGRQDGLIECAAGILAHYDAPNQRTWSVMARQGFYALSILPEPRSGVYWM